MDSPVLLLIFNRPRETAALLHCLRQQRPARLYVHADGPRPDRPGEAEKVAETRALIDSIDWECSVQRLFRNENMGLRAGVKNAIDWFFQQEEMGVILEDDLAPDPSFFRFCDEMLARYRHDERLLHVGGCNLVEDLTRDHAESYFFTQHTLVWGWASWRRAWQKMSAELDGFEAYRDAGSIKNFLSGRMEQAYWLEKFRATRARENNSWAYAWAFSVLKNNGLCITPKVNLVENVGVGSSEATHTKTADAKLRLRASTLDFPLRHPTNFSTDRRIEDTFFHRGQKGGWRLWAWFFLKKMRNFLAAGGLICGVIGAWLIASNIAAEQFIGTSGSGVSMGLTIDSYEWIAAAVLLAAAIFFMLRLRRPRVGGS